MQIQSPYALARRYLAPEWLVIVVAMVALAGFLGWQNGLGRLDRGIYDAYLASHERPANGDIIIVAIDDLSLAQLGRWPWPRSLHADLITRIAAARPAAIGLDIIFSEPTQANAVGNEPDDQRLAAAIQASGNVVLPVASVNLGTGRTSQEPLAELADAAAALGHLDLHIDPDGVVRSVDLGSTAKQSLHSHFALAVASLRHKEHQRISEIDKAEHAVPANRAGTDPTGPLHIRFNGGNGFFRTIPYVAVLRGEVPPDFFTGKYVLVGATAVGMNDSFPTPLSGTEGAMPGVEIHANILAGLLSGDSIRSASRWQTALLSALPVLAALIGFLWLSPRASLCLTLGLFAATLGASYLALIGGIWIAPAAALIPLALSYPLWSWRRLEAALRYLDQEFARLDREPALLPQTSAPLQPVPGAFGDVLDRRINAMAGAARRARDLRRFMADSLDNLPYATLVTTVDAHVVLSNRDANAYFASIGITEVQDALLPYLFSRLDAPRLVDQGKGSVEWWNLTDPAHTTRLAEGISATDPNGGSLLIKSAPCYDADNGLAGWIVSIVDLTAMRTAERSNDDMLRFLSHDMRSPQASIMALLELQKDPGSALPLTDLFARIEKACRKTIDLTESLVQLARAEAREYRLEETDFQELVIDATDEMWACAKDRHIYLISEVAKGEYPVVVDRGLMARALGNLLSNAILYSPAGSRVTCSLHLDEEFYTPQIVCIIKDQGYGIPREELPRLFRQTGEDRSAARIQYEGTGLGLRFVRTVIDRHRGEISAQSELGEGTTVTIRLPLAI